MADRGRNETGADVVVADSGQILDTNEEEFQRLMIQLHRSQIVEQMRPSHVLIELTCLNSKWSGHGYRLTFRYILYFDY